MLYFISTLDSPNPSACHVTLQERTKFEVGDRDISFCLFWHCRKNAFTCASWNSKKECLCLMTHKLFNDPGDERGAFLKSSCPSVKLYQGVRELLTISLDIPAHWRPEWTRPTQQPSLIGLFSFLATWQWLGNYSPWLCVFFFLKLSSFIFPLLSLPLTSNISSIFLNTHENVCSLYLRSIFRFKCLS